MTLSPEKLADNKLLTTSARLAIIFLTTVGLPVSGYIGMRVISYADAINAKLVAQNLNVQLLQLTVKNGFDREHDEQSIMQAQISDHEGRIRVLESRAK
jgi:hypothetical protein